MRFVHEGGDLLGPVDLREILEPDVLVVLRGKNLAPLVRAAEELMNRFAHRLVNVGTLELRHPSNHPQILVRRRNCLGSLSAADGLNLERSRKMSRLAPFVCLRCRLCFKRPFEEGVDFRPCAKCGERALRADVRFRVPKKSDEKQWRKVEFLFRHGFFFQKVYRMEHPGVYRRIRYPTDLAEAKQFVDEHKGQAISQRTALPKRRRGLP